jgi:chorismate dehydratase
LYRLGIVNFINTAPLLIPFLQMGELDGWQIVEDNPANLNRMLKAGEIDAGLISSFSFGANHRDYFVLDNYCISATGTVGSVLLFSRLPIYELSSSRIILTRQSETSVNLLYIILEYFNGFRPTYVSGTFHDFEASAESDAYLAIGDEALMLRRNTEGLFSYDLASMWYETTSLPFVFAIWAVRKEAGLKETPSIASLKKRLSASYHQGVSSLGDIAGMVCNRIPMPQGECLSYLKGIEFDLSPLKIKGLTHFFRLLMQMGKIPSEPRIEKI